MTDNVFLAVCLSVCAKYLKKLRTDFDEILWRGGTLSGRNRLDLGCILGGLWIIFFRIFYHWQIGRKVIVCNVSQQVMNGYGDIFLYGCTVEGGPRTSWLDFGGYPDQYPGFGIRITIQVKRFFMDFGFWRNLG